MGYNLVANIMGLSSFL